MNQVVPMHKGGAAAYTAQQMALVRKTVAKDCSEAEFDQFIHMARHLGLDPLRRQIYAFVFNKDDAGKRQLTLVTAIDGLRTIADRTNCYRPDEEEPQIEYSEEARDPNLNPKGLVKAKVRVFKFAHGDWHPVVGVARWDEFAPQREIWEYDQEAGKRRPTGRFELDPRKDNWRRMPHVMLAKCAEAQALRRAWPDDLSTLYEASEVDQQHTIDLSASEYAEMGETERRLEKIGGKDGIMFDFGNGLERVELGKAADRWMEIMEREEPARVLTLRDQNRVSLQEFWARSKADALELKTRFEALEKKAVLYSPQEGQEVDYDAIARRVEDIKAQIAEAEDREALETITFGGLPDVAMNAIQACYEKRLAEVDEPHGE